MLADMTNDPVALVVIGLTALMGLAGGAAGIAVAMKTLFSRPPVDPAKEFVTRDELRVAVVDIERKITGLREEIISRIERQDDYARKTAHEQAGAMGALMLKVQTLLALQGVKLRGDLPSGITLADVDK